jgi:nucleotide-binding universal stress UspA family protein
MGRDKRPAIDHFKTAKGDDMEKKILIAVDDSEHAKNAVRCAAMISSAVKNLTYTLFYVQPAVSQYLVDEAAASPKAKAALDKMYKKQTEQGMGILDDQKTRMMDLGIDDGRIETVTMPRNAGLAKDILQYAQDRYYDAIVVGRRGLSRLQEVFMGSLTRNLLEFSETIPVWIIDREITSTTIMLAVDGSAGSFRAADHLSFMVGGNPSAKITIFHVTPSVTNCFALDSDANAKPTEADEKELEEILKSGDKKSMDIFLAHARRMFAEAGLSEDQVTLKVVSSKGGIGKQVMREFKNGKYGALVIGRRGINKSFFMGSVSDYVLNKASDGAVWLVP